MKRLLTLLLLIVSANVFGQIQPQPSGVLTPLTTNQAYFRASDSTYYFYNGTNYLWNYFLNKQQADKLYTPINSPAITPFSLSTGYGLVGSSFNGSVARTWTADTASADGLVSKSRLATNLGGYVPKARTITINGATRDLSANRTWNVGTVTSVGTGYGLLGGAITSSGTLSVDTSAIATKSYTNKYVPYDNATKNVNLGEFGIRAGYALLDTTPTNTPTTRGTIYWDTARSTAALIMNGTTQEIGQDSYFYVKNSTGSPIAKGTAVRFAGTDGGSGHLLIAPFLANGTYPSSYFMGVTAEAIANGGFGQVMNFGELKGVNTNAYVDGDLLYASTSSAGGFQTTAPVAPNNIVLIAAVVNAANNGTIIVRPTYGSNINDDEGVKITNPLAGDVLQYKSSGLWENEPLDSAGIVPTSRTITINGTTQNLSANRTWNVGTVTSVAALTLGTSGNDLSSTVANGTTTPVITLNVPDASATARGVITTGSQTIAGAKTLTGALNGTSASFNAGITSEGAFIGTRSKSQSFFAGFGAGNASMSGGSNTFVGDLAGNVVTSGSSNTMVGRAAGTAQTTASGNTLIGQSAGVSLTTGGVNTFVGTDAGSGITTGTGNTILGTPGVIGTSSLTNNIILASGAGIKAQHDGTNWTFTGGASFSSDITVNTVKVGLGAGNISTNTVLGQGALPVNTTGYGLVAIGNRALEDNTTGTDNIAIGSTALVNNTTGYENIAIGTGSLITNTIGNRNISIGFLALSDNTDGEINVGVGNYALEQNTTGYANTSIGHLASQLNTTGYRNTALGQQSLYYNTTGSENIGIGALAGASTNTGNPNQTSTNSVYIGYDTRSSASGNTNEIVIGYSGRGLGSNTTSIGNSSTTFGRFWGNLLVGTSTNAGYALDVNGTGRFSGTVTSSNSAANSSTNFARKSFIQTGGFTSGYSAGAIYSLLSGYDGGSIHATDIGYYYDGAGYGLKFATNDNTSGDPIVRLDITSSGNVGIGTTSPTAMLHLSSTTPNFYLDDTSTSGTRNRFKMVSGDVGTTQSVLFQFDNTSDTNLITTMTVNESGNVGIGTTSPDASDWNASARLLHIYQNTTNGSVIKLESSNASGIVAVGNNAMQLGTITDDPLLFYTNITERMRIFSGGNVFIGSSPTDAGYKLDVNGTGRFSGSLTVGAIYTSTSSNTLGGFNTSNATGGYITWATNGTVIADLGTATQVFGSGGSEVFAINGRGARDIAFGTNNTERFRIASTGAATFNSSAAKLLEIGSTSASGGYTRFTYNTTTSIGYIGSSSQLSGLGIVSDLELRADNNLFLTTSGGSMKLASGGAATFSGLITSTSASDILTATSSNTSYKWINLANTGGNLVIGINNSAGGATMTTSAYASYIFTRNSTNLVLGTNEIARLTIASTGEATFSSLGTGTVYSNGGTLTNTNPSDLNLKTNIEDITYGLNEILQLKPKSYLWKEDKINQGKQFGFIAQDVQEVMPELVKQGEYLGLDKEAIFVILVNAIKELKAEIDILKNK